jgi:hypothetical protein
VEEKLEAERQIRITELRRRFVEGPVLIVPRGRNAAITTSGSTPIPGAGTVFVEYRTTGDWGSLESKGILDSADNLTLRLPMPYSTQGSTLVGNEWKVTLSPEWTVRGGTRMGDFEVVRAGR